MRKIAALATLLIAATTAARAGEILGRITSGGAAVPEGTTVEAKCGAKAYPAVKTDKAGGYHLVVAEAGKCTLTIGFKGQTATVDVASYADAAQADIVLEVKDGKLTARRK